VFVGRDPHIAVTGIDPRVGGATLELTGAVSSDQWLLPASGWTRKKGSFRYSDKGGRNGPVVTATIANQTVTVKAKGVQIRFALRGRGSQGAVAVRLIVPGSSPATLCAAFPGGQARSSGTTR
jgi:hypothetical protein